MGGKQDDNDAPAGMMPDEQASAALWEHIISTPETLDDTRQALRDLLTRKRPASTQTALSALDLMTRLPCFPTKT